MSHPPHETSRLPEVGISADLPQSVLDPEPQGAHHFFDGAGDIFSMYLVTIEEEDRKTVEGWKAEADGILTFTGLFSAAVATLISISIQDIRPNPQDTSNLYLANIYQAVVDPNRSNISSSLLSVPPTFSPPKYAVLVNLLWFMSLIISLICALLATLLQQWARKYIRATQPRFSPHIRLQVQAFFEEGVETLYLPRAVQILPTLLHLSLFLFLSGVIVFLYHVNRTIFELVLPWVCICAVLYGCVTFMPIFRHDSPYYTPLSSTVWSVFNGIIFVLLRVFRWSTSLRDNEAFEELEESYRQSLLQGMQKTIDGTAQNSPSRVGGRVLMRALDSLRTDDERELFFMGMPGFRISKVVADPLIGLTRLEKRRLFEALLDLMDRTFSSDLLTKMVKTRRAKICAKAINPADVSGAFRWILDKILTEDQYDGLKTAEFGHMVKRWDNGANKRTTVNVQTIVSVILARARKRDLSWFSLATEHLGVLEPDLRRYAVSDNSVSLVNLIHITRGLFSFLSEGNTLHLGPIVLKAVSQFNIQDTSPDLQRDFCTLWNQIVARGGPLDAREILKCIRNIYLDLHKGTNAAPTLFSESTSDLAWILDRSDSYPLCNVHGRHPNSTPHIHEVTSSTPIARASLHDNTAFVPASPVSTPDAPSSLPAPLRVDENVIHVPPLDDRTSVPVHRSTPETLTPAPPLTSTSPPSAVARRHNSDSRTASDVLYFPSPPISILDNIFPRDPPMSSDSPVTGSDPAHSFPESQSSMPATAPPGTPQLTSIHKLGVAAAEGRDSARAILHEDKDALCSPSVNRANTVTPTGSFTTDTIADPLRRSLDAHPSIY